MTSPLSLSLSAGFSAHLLSISSAARPRASGPCMHGLPVTGGSSGVQGSNKKKKLGMGFAEKTYKTLDGLVMPIKECPGTHMHMHICIRGYSECEEELDAFTFVRSTL